MTAPANDRAPCDHPLIDRVWLRCAAHLGFTVRRSEHVYASTDGLRTLEIGVRETLDADDSLAQLILHELCHGLVAGPEGVGRPDWGLDNREERADDFDFEHAAVRLQAELTSRFGLRQLLAPTTEVRSFYDAVASAPLGGAHESHERSVVLARSGLAWAKRRGWLRRLTAALRASAALLAKAAQVGRLHPLGEPLGPARQSCGGCGWYIADTARCRHHGRRRAEATWPSCTRWEPELDCHTCGACCREAYHSVTVSRRDPVVRRHPELIVAHPQYLEVRRSGERCAALTGDGSAASRFQCEIYEARPATCRQFERGSLHCLDARMRVGLSAAGQPRRSLASPPAG